MPPPPTRKEQLQLDELLSDIYRGIEALPDKSTPSNNYSSSGTYGTYQQFNKSSVAAAADPNRQLIARTHVKEYELPASSPLVKQHLAALREDLQSPTSTTNSSQHHQQYQYSPQGSNSNKQPQRSTLKRNTTQTPDIYNSATGGRQQQQQPQSLASFVTSTPTPENKRRVRIVDHPERRSSRNNNTDDGDYADYADYERAAARRRTPAEKPEKVKYVNTNKLIYHQEKNPDDNELSSDEQVQNNGRRHRGGNNNENNHDDDDDDDLDGKTRVEYYHTTWLDRQLGRASKRRSSKELNERQVKEKAMIEELKRSLKSGAITLRQSLRGKKNKHNSSQQNTGSNGFADDYQIETSLNPSHHHHSHSSPSKHPQHKSNAIGSGLATIPRNYGSSSGSSKAVYYPGTPVCYDTWVNKTRGSTSPASSGHHHHHQSSSADQPSSVVIKVAREEQPSGVTIVSGIGEPRNSYTYSQQTTTTSATTPKQISSSGGNYLLSSNNNNTTYNSSTLKSNRMQPQYQTRQQAEPTTTTSNLYSRTLPHKSRQGEHSLIESHLRGSGASRNYTLDNRAEPKTNIASSTLPCSSGASAAAGRETPTSSNMRNPSYASPSAGLRSPTQQQQSCSTMERLRQRPGNEPSIGNIPSATEVVRSALSRSSSQVSLNQLNKTVNLLPYSPPPYSPSPAGQTPTRQLAAASPSLSPSPATGAKCSTYHSAATPDSLASRATTATATTTATQQQRLYGTRTLDRGTTAATNQPSRQPIYANPHASLMQHKAEQQARQPSRNTASIREFNELDSLLRSLSPAASQYQSSTHITPGFSSKPAPTSVGGYGFTAPAASAAATTPTKPGSDLYARVQKPTGIYQTPATATDQTKASYLHQNYALANQQQRSNQPYTIDVTNKKADDENCFKRQELSEFEAPIELLPSMEDYQNITKLNPVKNHYWYKPNMSRDRAISLLKDKPQGTFIVRDSTSFRGAYGLALKVAKLPKNVLNNASLRNYNSNDPTAELIRHFLIEPTPSGVRLKGYENEPVFNSLPDLIYQHSLTELALPCRLIIPRADIEDPNFNYKQKQFFDDFVASKELAKHLPYERTSPNGGYRKYPGDVYVHNEHRIIFE